ncbi:MAG: CBS domain-containing protein [Bacteroidia bacterium]
MEMLELKQVMTSKPKVVQSTASIKEVAKIFAEEQYHALPEVEGSVLVGIVTTTDVIRYLLDQY